MTYTLDDLKRAQDNLARLEELWDKYTGNNPNNYRAARRRGQKYTGAPGTGEPWLSPRGWSSPFSFRLFAAPLWVPNWRVTSVT